MEIATATFVEFPTEAQTDDAEGINVFQGCLKIVPSTGPS